MSSQETKGKIEAQKKMIDADRWLCCLNCDHYDGDENEGCILADHRSPPAKVMVVGCELWEDSIPF